MPGVFIDTSVLRQHNFDVGSAPFVTLAALAREEVVTILLPDITREEIRAGVADLVGEFEGALRSAVTKGRVLVLSDAAALVASMKAFDAQTSIEAANVRIDAYFAYARAITLPAMHAPAAEVFQNYFDRRPPFGRGKKKAEFPDAFVVAELLRWVDRTQQDVIVISQDGDLQAVCEGSRRLLHTGSLPVAVSDLLRDHSIPAARLHSALQNDKTELQNEVAAAVFLNGVSLADVPNGETENLFVNSVALEDIAVIEAEDDHAIVEASAMIEIMLDAEFADPSSYYYDSEDKQGTYLGTVRQWLSRTLEVPAEFDVSIGPDGPESHFSVRRAKLNRGAPLEVYVDEDAANHWK